VVKAEQESLPLMSSLPDRKTHEEQGGLGKAPGPSYRLQGKKGETAEPLGTCGRDMKGKSAKEGNPPKKNRINFPRIPGRARSSGVGPAGGERRR